MEAQARPGRLEVAGIVLGCLLLLVVLAKVDEAAVRQEAAKTAAIHEQRLERPTARVEAPGLVVSAGARSWSPERDGFSLPRPGDGALLLMALAGAAMAAGGAIVRLRVSRPSA